MVDSCFTLLLASDVKIVKINEIRVAQATDLV